MHGSVVKETEKWDTFVITEEDYVDFLSRMAGNRAFPAALYEYFRNRSFLFLGYSLSDWNLRVILNKLKRRLPARRDNEQAPSWAIQGNPSELDRKLWGNRDVKIFDMDLREFVARMQADSGA
jgi:hypothetical protein